MVFDEVPNISNVGDFFVCSILETIIKLYSKALYEHTCANLSENYTPLSHYWFWMNNYRLPY